VGAFPGSAMTQNIYYDVSREIYKLVLDCCRDERGVHAETAVAAVSAVCGEELLRACPVDLSTYPQGGFVLTEQVNDSGPRMLGRLEELLNDLAVPHADNWSAKIPVEHAPHRDPLRLAHELRPRMLRLIAKHGLTDEQVACAACTALALLIRDCREVLPPAVSVVIVSNTMIRASKSVPLA
jgi:hypothetical protein